MTREFELRLVGHPAGDGELLASDAVAIIAAFKELAYRLTRAAADKAGLGRTDAALERLAEVRVALRGGGNRLVFTVGDPDALDIDPNAPDVDEAFWRLVRGLEANRRPSGVSDSVAESVDDLLVALQRAASGVEIVAQRRKPIVLTTRMLDRRPWQRRPAPATDAQLHGMLEMVDLHTGRFRLRAPDGSAVDLIEVVNANLAAALVGSHVAATGVLAVGGGTRHHRMEQPMVAASEPLVVEPGVAGFVRVLPGQTSIDDYVDDAAPDELPLGEAPGADEQPDAAPTETADPAPARPRTRRAVPDEQMGFLLDL